MPAPDTKQRSKKKIIGLRTFADDVKRVRGTTSPARTDLPSEPAVPKEETKKDTPPTLSSEVAELIDSETPDSTQDSAEAAPAPATKVPEPPIETVLPPKKIEEKTNLKNVPRLKRITVPEAKVTLEDVPTTTQTSVLSNKDGVFDTEEAALAQGDGSIVTDRKGRRFRLFSAIGAAISGWFTTKQKTITAERKPKRLVEKATRRKDVIAAAATQARHAPRDDYAAVSERLREVERLTEVDELHVKDPDAVPEPQWNYIEEQEEEHVKALESLESAIDGTLDEDSGAAPPSPPAVAKSDGAPSAATPVDAPEPRDEMSHPEPTIDSPPNESAPPKTLGAPEEKPELETSTDVPNQPTAAVAPTDVPHESTVEPEVSTQAADTEIEVQPDSEDASAATSQSPTPTPAPLKPAPRPATPVPDTTQTEAMPSSAGGYADYREQYGDTYAPSEDTFMTQEDADIPPESGADSVPRFRRTPVPDYRLDRSGHPISKRTGTPYLTFAAVSIVAIILGVGTTIWWFTKTPTEITNGTPTITGNLKEQALTGIPLTTDRATFYSSLNAHLLQAGSGDQELVAEQAGTVADPEAVFRNLAWQAPSNFARSVSSIIFGFSEGEPFIIMKTVSFDTAFAGMLAWEASLSADLAPLFGPYEITVATDARTNNRDVRILRSVDGSDKIVYGFVDKQTVLITTDRALYARIATLMQ